MLQTNIISILYTTFSLLNSPNLGYFHRTNFKLVIQVSIHRTMTLLRRCVCLFSKTKRQSITQLVDCFIEKKYTVTVR